MKKVVLLNVPLGMIYDSRNFPPLGISSMAASLRAKGYFCDVIDGDLPGNQDIEELVSRLINYDLIGLSATTPSMHNAAIIAEMIKERKDLPIVLGGHYATFMHEYILSHYNFFDIIIRGEGESAIVALCEDYFTNGEFTKSYDYLTAKNINGKQHIATSIAHEKDLDSLPFPIRDDCEKYYNGDSIITISSSRGCPYGCNFCSATNFRRQWVGRSPDNIANEVYEIYVNLKKKDFNIVFVDDNFYIDPSRSLQIMLKIEEKCHKQFGFIFATRADQIINNGTEYLRELKMHGCIEIEMGIENGSLSVLRRYNKNTTPDQNIQAIQMIQDQGIKAVTDIILFDPEITIEELRENVHFFKVADLWGFDPPLVYEKIVAFPGTDFTKSHPELYSEDCSIASIDYFQDKKALEVYRYMLKFRILYQFRIDRIIASIRSMHKSSTIPTDCFSHLSWLKTIPYALLEYLVSSDTEYKLSYKTFITQNNVDSRLFEYEKKYVGLEN